MGQKRKADAVLPRGFLEQLERNRQSTLSCRSVLPPTQNDSAKCRRNLPPTSGNKDADGGPKHCHHHPHHQKQKEQEQDHQQEEQQAKTRTVQDEPAKRPSALCRLAGIMKVGCFYGEGGNNAIVQKLHVDALRISRTTVAKEFSRQQLAFDFADSVRGEEVHTFAREIDNTGKRRFLVTSYGELYRRVQIARAFQQSHFYEIIREGCACALYFDVEFSKLLNPGKDGNEALEVFLAFLPTAIRTLLPGHDLSLRREDIVDMDSSTAKKYSRHLIIRLNGGSAVFQNTSHMGSFVCRLATHISQQRSERPDLDRCFAMNSNNNRTIFLDLGVYTKNRCFRTAFSSKFGKPSALLAPSSANASQYDLGEDEVFFYRSLVCRIPSSVDREMITIITDPSVLPVETGARNHTGVFASSGGCDFQGCASSWPLLDSFILKFWNERAGTPHGKIHSVACLSGSDLLLYKLSGNKWCDHVGRQHQSNGVFLMVDKAKGCFYQKCFDPDCRLAGARSNDFPLPREVLPDGWGLGSGLWAQAVHGELFEEDQSGGAGFGKEDGAVDDDDEWDEQFLAAADQAVLDWEARKAQGNKNTDVSSLVVLD